MARVAMAVPPWLKPGRDPIITKQMLAITEPVYGADPSSLEEMLFSCHPWQESARGLTEQAFANRHWFAFSLRSSIPVS
jgi:hypothetical protein